MANPVNNEGFSAARIGVGDAGLGAELKAGVRAAVSEAEGREALGQVNRKLNENPNHARDAGDHGDAAPPAEPADGDQLEMQARPLPRAEGRAGTAATTVEPTADQQEQDLPNQMPVIRPVKNAGPHEVPPGQRGKGHGQTPPPMPAPQFPQQFPQTQTPLPTQTQTQTQFPLPRTQTQTQTQTQFPPTQTPTQFPRTTANQTANWPAGNNPGPTVSRENVLTRQVIDQVLRQNDIYVSNGALNRVLTGQTPPGLANNPKHAAGVNAPPVAPGREVGNLVQHLGSRVFSVLNGSENLNGRVVRQLTATIAREFHEQIQVSKHAILKDVDLSAKHFRQLTVRERMMTAVEMMPPHLPEKAAARLERHQPREIFNALMLTRGLVAGGEKTAEARNLVASQNLVWRGDVSLTQLRDVGQLVKILIADSAAAKSTAQLDLAVQKFVRILLANNELGVLLATVSLSVQMQDRGVFVSRSLALAQIYELIMRLAAAGEKALKDAAPPSAAGLAFETENHHAAAAALGAADEESAPPLKLHAAEAALRQFLEFNPAGAFDRTASVLQNPDDARRARSEFADLYRDDIDSWLKSGNHRFVKEIDLEKPLGVVVERGGDCFTAGRMRVVLVRDGSVQGWHFLRSFLVR
jgi:hypothetical protein